MPSSGVPTPASPPWRDSRSRPAAESPVAAPPPQRRLSTWTVVVIVVIGLSLVASLVLLAWNLWGSRPVAAVFEVGQCADDVVFDGSPVTEVIDVDCSQVHQVEVYALVGMPGDGPYPGDEEVDGRAAQLCRTAASAELVGLDPGWQLKALRPSVDSWDQGDRTVTCFLTRASGNKTAGSITSG
ncbi:MAG TPA: septum formation family protein [Nitriliruptoraceae bacterium]|nr:septum formation family protein [Nitriliruptoraceae bacterium]